MMANFRRRPFCVSPYKSNSSAELSRKIIPLKWLRLAVIAFVLVLTGAVAQAQPFNKIPQIGLLSAGSSCGWLAADRGIPTRSEGAWLPGGKKRYNRIPVCRG